MKAFFVIFFFADVVGVLAQTLTGKVVNTWDEEPMYGGCVVLAKDSVIGFVENDGTFHVQVPVDAKEISFRFIGFHSLIVNIGDSLMDKNLGTLYMFKLPPPTHLKSGVLQEPYEDGKLNEYITIRRNLPDGKYVKYRKDGSLQITGHYKKGNQVGGWKYYPDDGQVINILPSKSVAR